MQDSPADQGDEVDLSVLYRGDHGHPVRRQRDGRVVISRLLTFIYVQLFVNALCNLLEC